MMNCAQKVVALFSLSILAGCSFHSSQWESAKALWALRNSETLIDKESYWWDMSYEGETYRLFPVSWNDKIVLTDASRWMVVLRNSDIVMIRDSLEGQQTSFEYQGKVRKEELIAMLPDGGSSLSFKSYGEDSEHALGISIVEGAIGQSQLGKKSTVFCYPPQLNRQSLRSVRACTFGELSVASFDHSGNIIGLELSTPSDNRWSIHRSQDPVGARDVKHYLEGVVDGD